MAVAIVSLIIVVAAIAVLFGCLRGFSQAAKQQKIHGLLVRADYRPKGQADGLLDFPFYVRSARDTTSVVSCLSKNTAGVVRLAIVLRSKGAGSATAMPSTLVRKSGGNTRPQN